MIPEPDMRELLVASGHSSVEAEQRILGELQSPAFMGLPIHIAVDADDHHGDAPAPDACSALLVSCGMTRSTIADAKHLSRTFE